MTRLALVGYGRIAPKHLEVFRAQGAEFVACCNRSPEKRRQAETEGGIPRTYAAIDAMLESERPDGVVCCVSPDQMAAAAGQILPFGIPTLLEKPPGVSLAELAAMKALAKKHATPVMVALNRRYYSVLRSAIVDAGGLEAITAVFVDWSEEPEYLLKDRRFTPEQVGQEVYANSIHGLDLLTLLAGEVDAPAVIGLDLGQPFRWLMSLQGVSRRGVLATFQSTWDSPSRWRVVFCSQNRRYTFAPLESCVVLERGKKETRVIEPDAVDKKFKAGFHAQAREFLNMIETRRPSARDGLESVEAAMGLCELLSATCQADRGPAATGARS
jgi:predicted dehydrogenase